MTELEIQDEKLKIMCPDGGWCEAIHRFLNPRNLEIWRNECADPCYRRNYFIRSWLEQAELDVPEIYKKLTLTSVMEAIRLGQADPNTKISMKYQETKNTIENDKPSKGCGPCSKSKKTLPNLVKKVVNVTKSGVKFIESGFKKADKDTYNKRIDMCLECDHKYYDKFGKLRCDDCGCFLRLKARMACESCPLADPKWGPAPNCEESIE